MEKNPLTPAYWLSILFDAVKINDLHIAKHAVKRLEQLGINQDPPEQPISSKDLTKILDQLTQSITQNLISNTNSTDFQRQFNAEALVLTRRLLHAIHHQ